MKNKKETDNFLAKVIFGDRIPKETEAQRNYKECEEFYMAENSLTQILRDELNEFDITLRRVLKEQ